MQKIESGRRGGKLYKCLLSLVELLQDRQKEIEVVSGCLPKLKLAKEFGTVKLCTARGCGHTTAIAILVKEKFNKVVVIFSNLKMSNNFLKVHADLKDKIIVASPDSLERLYGLSDFDAVIVDCCSLMSQSCIEEIYDITAYSMKKPMYIFME